VIALDRARSAHDDSNMRVLVLGSTGFLGGLLVADLRREGHDVEAWSRSEIDEPRAARRRVDLGGTEPLPTPLARVDAAILLAGPSVPARFTTARDGAATLCIAERALAHLARHAAGARVVVVSSAHVLAPADAPLDESAQLAPRGDYAAAKAAVEDLARAARPEVDVVIARIFGSLGPGLPRGLFLPDLLARLVAGEPHIRLAGPDGVRDWTDGRDVATALRLLATIPLASERVFHVGSGRPTRLSDCATRLAHALGSTARIEFAAGASPTWIADATRLRDTTGWRPQHDLGATIAWIREHTLASPSTTWEDERGGRTADAGRPGTTS